MKVPLKLSRFGSYLRLLVNVQTVSAVAANLEGVEYSLGQIRVVDRFRVKSLRNLVYNLTHKETHPLAAFEKTEDLSFSLQHRSLVNRNIRLGAKARSLAFHLLKYALRNNDAVGHFE